MRMTAKRVAVTIGLGVAAGVVLRPGSEAHRNLRRGVGRLSRRLRYRRGQAEGMVYRLRGGRPDPFVSDDVLADRVRSELGPLEAELDIPRLHVMAENHVILLHGEVARPEQIDLVEEAVAAVSGVAALRSHLSVGLLPSDTRPSTGRDQHTGD
jgi:osmotically-inducible protein OsmY